MQWVDYRRGKLSLGNPNVLEWSVSMPSLLVEDIIFITLDGEHSSPLLLRETLSFKSVSKHTACSGGRLFLILEHFLSTHSFKDFSGKKGFPGDSDGKVSACSAGDPGSMPGSGRSPGEGNGNPLQYSCLENSIEEGAW